MLSILHNQIEKIVPINGVSQNFDGTIEVFYNETPNEQQLIQVTEIISSWPLEEKKLEKLSSIESEWKILEATGWDCGNGHLGITANDVALLSGCHALGKEADALGLSIPSIVTMENNEITFTTMAQFTQLMLQYGAYRAHLSSTFAARRRAVAAATTLEELESIP